MILGGKLLISYLTLVLHTPWYPAIANLSRFREANAVCSPSSKFPALWSKVNRSHVAWRTAARGSVSCLVGRARRRRIVPATVRKVPKVLSPTDAASTESGHQSPTLSPLLSCDGRSRFDEAITPDGVNYETDPNGWWGWPSPVRRRARGLFWNERTCRRS